MSFARTDEDRLLGDNLRRFLEAENDFEHRRQRLTGASPQRMALWAGLAELGVLGAAFSEDEGGFGGEACSVALVMAELGRALAVEPFLGSAVIAGRVLSRWIDSTAREMVLSEIIGGQRVELLAHDAGSDPFALPLLSARLDAQQHYVLTGRIRCIRHADVADHFLATANVDGDLAVFLLPRRTQGLTLNAYRLMDGSGAADLHLSAVRLPSAARLEFDASPREVVRAALEWGLLGLVAETSGMVDALNDITFQYLSTRKQFGQLIGSFQALQHRAADMFIAAEELRAIADCAIQALGGPASPQRAACLSAAKATADKAGRLIGHEAIQMHGGMGVSDELNVSHYGRRLATIRTELGCGDIHRLHFANLS